MVFVGGPRQVGKTTLAKQLPDATQAGYLNWDIASHRERIMKHQLPQSKLWIFDEIHKYSKWRNYLKGIYDQFHEEHKILVTGSARLDYYRHGGDSLQGRYHYLRLNPLSVAELGIQSFHDFEDLLKLGGFPEPFFSASEIESKRWSREYRQRLIQEDLLSLENVKDIGTLELLMLRLPELVGSPLSINALREDLQISHKTADRWLNIFERLYALFRIPPFGSPIIRAVKKEKKHYHYDWTLVDEKGARLENMIALHLLKWVQYLEDTQAKEMELRYFRDVDGREVDFIITEKSKPILAIECKSNDSDVSKHLKYFKERFPDCDAWQLTLNMKKDFISKENIRVCHALTFLKELV
ncbi:MAG: ATP-binding protein [Gammaproteobacteria bacterium]